MSRANIISIEPDLIDLLQPELSLLDAAGCTVVFETRDGGIISYHYEGAAAIAIMTGADPADLPGERVG